MINTIYLPLSLVALLSWFSYVSAAGWTVDDSCAGELGNKVRASMVEAFVMAADAATELNKDPVNEDVLKVYRYLFADTQDVRHEKVRSELIS